MAWQDKALCRGRTDIEFFPPPGGADRQNLQKARELCSRCPVSRACLADVRPGEAGIWAGTTENQRRTMTLNRRRKAEAACGTDAGYYRHVRSLGELACDECRAAHRRYEAERNRKARAS